jgi:cobalt-zinc-cadmium efflux system membrane fusion protein
MKYLFPLLALAGLSFAEDAPRDGNMVVLDETGVQNLRIEATEVEETTFEKTVFALGRIEAIPASRSGVTSRIPGRIVALNATVGDVVEEGQEVAVLESRQAGDPPPTITLKARRGGIVTKGDIALGEPLEPESTLMEITDLSEVWAIARVPEHQAGEMKPGTAAHIRVASLPGEVFDGELLRFGIEADRESGTLDAIFKLPNPDLAIRPGMRAEFSIVLSQREEVMSVPRSALQGEPSARFVYVRDFDLETVFLKAPVVIGEMNDRFVEIVSGVLPADEVVTRGAYSLAFAGAGSISLKEVLDAAHGHEHAADGAELTPESKGNAAGASGHDDEHEHGGISVWMIVSIILFLLLIASVFIRKPVGKEGA